MLAVVHQLSRVQSSHLAVRTRVLSVHIMVGSNGYPSYSLRLRLLACTKPYTELLSTWPGTVKLCRTSGTRLSVTVTYLGLLFVKRSLSCLRTLKLSGLSISLILAEHIHSQRFTVVQKVVGHILTTTIHMFGILP